MQYLSYEQIEKAVEVKVAGPTGHGRMQMRRFDLLIAKIFIVHLWLSTTAPVVQMPDHPIHLRPGITYASLINSFLKHFLLLFKNAETFTGLSFIVLHVTKELSC